MAPRVPNAIFIYLVFIFISTWLCGLIIEMDVEVEMDKYKAGHYLICRSVSGFSLFSRLK